MITVMVLCSVAGFLTGVAVTSAWVVYLIEKRQGVK